CGQLPLVHLGADLRRLHIHEKEDLDPLAVALFDTCLKFVPGAKARVRLVIRVAAIMPAHVPPADEDGMDAVLFRCACPARNIAETELHITFRQQKHGVQKSKLAVHPVLGWIGDTETGAEPVAVDTRRGVPITLMELDMDGRAVDAPSRPDVGIEGPVT